MPLSSDCGTWTTMNNWNADLQDYISMDLASQLKIMKDDLKLIVTSATGRQVSTGPHEGRMHYDKLQKQTYVGSLFKITVW